MRRSAILFLSLLLPSVGAHADVLYSLALTASDGSGINGTGSFALSQLPPPITDPSQSIIRIYRPYDPNDIDPYGDVLDSIDFFIDGFHFFLDPFFPPFTYVEFYETYDPAYPNGYPSPPYPYDIFFDTDAPDPNPFAYVFDVSANPAGYYQYMLDLNLGTDHSFFTEGVVTITDIQDVPAQTPEPSSLALLGTGLLGVLGVVKRRFA